ncbi:MAG: hypothetical protein ABH821_01675 [archaeon]
MSKLNERGQVFAVYRLLIGSILAIAILSIILGALGYFESQKVDIGVRRIYDGVKQASQAPDLGSGNDSDAVLVLDDVIISEGGFTSRSLAQYAKLGDTCVTFGAVDFASIELESDGIFFNESISIDVYIKCALKDTACPVECWVNFGKAFSGPS